MIRTVEQHLSSGEIALQVNVVALQLQQEHPSQLEVSQ